MPSLFFRSFGGFYVPPLVPMYSFSPTLYFWQHNEGFETAQAFKCLILIHDLSISKTVATSWSGAQYDAVFLFDKILVKTGG